MSRGVRAVSWTLLGLLVLGAVVEAFLANWRAAGLFGGYAAALALFVALQKRVPPALELVAVAVAILNASAWVWDLYRASIPFDRFIHCVSTMAATFVAFPYLYAGIYGALRERSLAQFAAAITLGAGLGAWWEIVEFFIYLPRLASSPERD